MEAAAIQAEDTSTQDASKGDQTLEQQNIDLVLDFIQAIEIFDYDTAFSLTTDDLHYRNHPVPGTNTKEGGLKQLKMLFTGVKTFRSEVVHIAANGNTVLTERAETFDSPIFHIAFPVAGVFKIRDGKIYEWRDHFDFLTLMISSVKSPFIVIGRLFK